MIQAGVTDTVYNGYIVAKSLLSHAALIAIQSVPKAIKSTRPVVIHVYNATGTVLLATFNTVTAFQLFSKMNGSDVKDGCEHGIL